MATKTSSDIKPSLKCAYPKGTFLAFKLNIFEWGVVMKKQNLALAVAITGLMSFATVADSRVCKTNYYNGEGHSRTWQQGINNAYGDWSRKIRNKFGSLWSKWARAKVRDESCSTRGWPHTEWCNVEAYPCK